MVELLGKDIPDNVVRDRLIKSLNEDRGEGEVSPRLIDVTEKFVDEFVFPDIVYNNGKVESRFRYYAEGTEEHRRFNTFIIDGFDLNQIQKMVRVGRGVTSMFVKEVIKEK